MSDVLEFKRRHGPPTDPFYLGWEFGLIDCALGLTPEYERLIHWENESRVREMAALRGYAVDIKYTTPPAEGWLIASFTKDREAANG